MAREKREVSAITWLGVVAAASALRCSAPVSPPVVIAATSTSSSPSAPRAALPRLEKCERTVSWGPGTVVRTPNCRDQGRLCSDLNKSVTFPVCTPQILVRVIDYEQLKELRQRSDYYERLPDVAVRGYLRRHYLSPRKGQLSSGSVEPGRFNSSSGFSMPANDTCPGDTEWKMRLEYKRRDGCQILRIPWPDLPTGEGFGRGGDFLCWGDMTVACCATSLVDSDSEVVVYWDNSGSNGLRFCVPEPTPQSSQVSVFVQRDEDAIDTKDLP